MIWATCGCASSALTSPKLGHRRAKLVGPAPTLANSNHGRDLGASALSPARAAGPGRHLCRRSAHVRLQMRPEVCALHRDCRLREETLLFARAFQAPRLRSEDNFVPPSAPHGPAPARDRSCTHFSIMGHKLHPMASPLCVPAEVATATSGRPPSGSLKSLSRPQDARGCSISSRQPRLTVQARQGMPDASTPA